MFELNGMRVRIEIPIPNKEDNGFRLDSRGRPRTESSSYQLWEKEYKRRMRALAAVIKAKLIAVDEQVATMEQEFLPYIVLPNDVRVGDVLIPRIHELSSGALALPGISSQ